MAFVQPFAEWDTTNEEIVISTAVMLVYPKATSKTQGILAVFQHENMLNHGCALQKALLEIFIPRYQVFIWMVSYNGPSYFPEGQVYLARLTRQSKAKTFQHLQNL